MGGRKLFHKLQDFFKDHQIKMGRDAFFNLLLINGLLIKKRKRYTITTNSKHWMRKYPNLIREFIPKSPNQLWVSDITYWKLNDKHLYISFITDAYSRKIVGYHVAETLEAVETIKALEMAVKTLKNISINKLIHHSDRGVQYCSRKYVNLLIKNGIEISMTENGDPLENSIAERINGIIKEEYLFDYNSGDLSDAKKILYKVVKLYNQDRPHTSINFLTPFEAHQQIETKEIKRLWKNYYKKKQEIVSLV
jgi:putative transposase